MSDEALETRDFTPLAGSHEDMRRRSKRERRRRQEGFFGVIPERAYREPVFVGRGLFGRWAVVSDPAAVRRVLVEQSVNYPKTKMDIEFFAAIFGGGLLGLEGEDWRRHRRIMAPAFDPRSVAAYGPAMAASIQNFLARWDALPDEAPIDMSQEMTTLTLEVISRTVFSADGGEMGGLVRDMLVRGAASAESANLLDLLPVIGPWRMKRRKAELAEASQPLDVAVEALL
ncbi:MAG TPA: cytochrome P450, partial [Caulobacteraceae bacterium]|nr:cytochrome P450 [Caulobacteraceae bacterium]